MRSTSDSMVSFEIAICGAFSVSLNVYVMFKLSVSDCDGLVTDECRRAGSIVHQAATCPLSVFMGHTTARHSNSILMCRRRHIPIVQKECSATIHLNFCRSARAIPELFLFVAMSALILISSIRIRQNDVVQSIPAAT